jgi:cobalt/nickel transport protein
MNQSKKGISNWFLLGGVVILSALPFIVARNAEAVNEVQPEYKPWFQPLMQAPSGEVQTFLFASQAALGAGVLGYLIGLSKGRTERRNHHEDAD